MKFIRWILLFLILLDWSHTYIQCYQSMFLDGDMPGIIVPAEDYKLVLKDPLGMQVLLNDKVYAAPNRYFSHFFQMTIFSNLPLFIQNFVDPVESLYISVAFFRTLLQVSLIILLSIYISWSAFFLKNERKITFTNMVISAALVTPLFQIHGYNEYMGITMNSITYTLSYALPFVFVLLYFLPFYLEKYKKPGFLLHLFLILLAFIIAFGGPLGSPIIIITCSMILLFIYIKNFHIEEEAGLYRFFNAFRKMNNVLLIHFIFIITLCLYSLYIGKNNSENLWYSLPIIERYKLLPTGFSKIMFEKMGNLLLFLVIIINSVIIVFHGQNKNRVLYLLTGIVICSIIYLLLLPLGGFRGYRPLIIRLDTFSPVSLALILGYGISSFYVLKLLDRKIKWIFIIILLTIAFIYTNADKEIQWEMNGCERTALRTIAASKNDVVVLDNYWCNVLGWEQFRNAESSRLASKLLQKWNVIDSEKLYYFPENYKE